MARVSSSLRLSVAEDLAGSHAGDVDDRHPEGEAHPVLQERLPDDLGRVRILARQELRGIAQERHLRAEAAERLRQLASDRPAAHDRQTRRVVP